MNQSSHADAYLLNMHSNIFYPHTQRLPKGPLPVDLPVKALKMFLPSPMLLHVLPTPIDVINYINKILILNTIYEHFLLL